MLQIFVSLEYLKNGLKWEEEKQRIFLLPYRIFVQKKKKK